MVWLEHFQRESGRLLGALDRMKGVVELVL